MEQRPGRKPRRMAALEGRGQQERHFLGRPQAHAGGAAVEDPVDPSAASSNALLA